MLHKLCTNAVSHVEIELANQKASDEAEAQKMEEDHKKIDKMARLEAEHEEKEKADALRLMKEEEESIKAMERELEHKKKALHDAQKAAELFSDNAIDEDDEDEDEDMLSVSTTGEQVSNL
jgi:hypothetical protein